MKYRGLLLILTTAGFVFPIWAGENHKYSIYGGLMYPEQWQDGHAFGASLRIYQTHDNALFLSHINYWRSGKNSKQLMFENISISLDYYYYFSDKLEGLYLGAGLSLNLLTWKYILDYRDYRQYQVALESFENRIGLTPRMGYKFNLGGLSPFLEIKYNKVKSFNNSQVIVGFTF